MTLVGHKAGLLSAEFSPDGSLVLTGGHDRDVHVWDAQTGECLVTHVGNRGAVNVARFLLRRVPGGYCRQRRHRTRLGDRQCRDASPLARQPRHGTQRQGRVYAPWPRRGASRRRVPPRQGGPISGPDNRGRWRRLPLGGLGPEHTQASLFPRPPLRAPGAPRRLDRLGFQPRRRAGGDRKPRRHGQGLGRRRAEENSRSSRPNQGRWLPRPWA